MRLCLQLATVEQAPEISALRQAVAADLAEQILPNGFHWTPVMKRPKLYAMR